MIFTSSRTVGGAKAIAAGRLWFVGSGIPLSMDGTMLMNIEVGQLECKNLCGESQK